MRLTVITAALLLTATTALAADLAPDWRLASGDGGSVRLSQEVEKQPVILFFWATWCPYCKALMPHLQSIRLEFGDSVKILAVNIRDKNDPVAFIEKAGYDFTVLPHGDEVAELYEIYGTPGVIVIDGEQRAQFDLRLLPQFSIPSNGKKLSNSTKAAYLAPYWAAEIRKSIDAVLAETEQ